MNEPDRCGEFTIRGTYNDEDAECIWRDGMLQAPHEVALVIEEMIKVGEPVDRELAIPWREAGAATMDDRWLAQAVIFAVLDDGAELEDPVLEAERASWPPDAAF